MISIKGLNKFFNKGRQNEIHVLNGINLELGERGMTAIFGKSGCGKTTLLNVIGGLDGFLSGEVSIEGKDVQKNTDLIRNKYVGYIFQNYNLSKNETCFDNVAAALRLCGISDEEEIATRVTAALRNVGMENYKNRTPDTLSGGQQQRIAIARAIVKNPKIILADEPTGNLDEANTVMIMDLLKAISEEHLVLLVTHEENLVKHYCDRVIEVSDGKIISEKTNPSAKGYSGKSKSDIYLGELEKSELISENAKIEYYGDAPEAPITIKLVNKDGKIYVQLESSKIQVLDETSEIKLVDGVFEKEEQEKSLKRIDMSDLPTIEGNKFGRLFSFSSSVKSGYLANFKQRKRGTKALSVCMILFSAVNVFMNAIFGTAFRDLARSEGAYNHNTFYLYTPSGEISEKLNSALGDESTGIDYLRLTSAYPTGDVSVAFTAGSFETFNQFDLSSVFRTNAVFLDTKLAQNLTLLAGKKSDLTENDIVITSKVADDLVEKSTVGYVKERRDLLGLSSYTQYTGFGLRIAGIVESDESAIFVSPLLLAKSAHSEISASAISLGSDYDVSVDNGKTVLVIKNRIPDVEYPQINETVTIQGKSFVVIDIKEAKYGYSDWLLSKGIDKKEENDYFTELVLSDSPDLSTESQEFKDKYNKLRDEKIFEYYDYYYSEIKEFDQDLYFFETQNFYVWLYLEKGVEEAKYSNLPPLYYSANIYKEKFGKYPTETELKAIAPTLPTVHEVLQGYHDKYEGEFYRTANVASFGASTYMISEEDYVELSRRIGETHPSAEIYDNYFYLQDGYVKSDVAYDKYYEEPRYYDELYYTVIHSNDPEKTEKWLEDNFLSLEEPSENMKAIVLPSDIFGVIINEGAEEIISGFISIAVVSALTCISMYFIMRASLMNRIKEIGIYRAIGVSKRNLIFRFLIEASLLAALTVLVGYLLSSAFLCVCLENSSLMAEIFYYPAWLAICVLALISSATVFSGTLPVILLLRRTPSEILSKYDI